MSADDTATQAVLTAWEEAEPTIKALIEARLAEAFEAGRRAALDEARGAVEAATMKLWVLTRTGPVGYDETGGFVIRAESEAAARAIAAEEVGKYDGCDWTEPGQATCEALTAQGEAGIILKDFNAG